MAEILGLIAAFKDELLKVGGIIKDELDQCLDKGLQKYVENYKSKYSETKTFLFREHKENFYNVYFPMSLGYKRRQKQVPDNVDELFSENQYITILGHAGTGKTMLLKHCFLSCLKYSHQIPIVIEFRNLNSYEGTILDYRKEFVFNMHLAQNERILERLLSFGRFAFLFDGFDEISLAIKDKRIRELEAFIDSYMHNNFLLTSRPDANAENLHRFENYRICKLNGSEIEQFLKMQTQRIEDGDTLEKRILELIRKKENIYYLSYISNPLLLSMFIFTFNNHPELPKRKSDFYYNVFDTLYSRHDTLSKHGGYTHDKKTSLERHDFEYILQCFSYISTIESKYTFSKQYLHETFDKIRKTQKIEFITDDLIYDLSVSISVLINDGTDYIFPHRSLQEYFTAGFISSMNENAKFNKIYNKEKYGLLFEDNLNLWFLCNEMDKYCFTKYFLIVILKDFIFKLGNKDEENISKEQVYQNFMDLFKISFIHFEDGKVGYGTITLYSIYSYVLKFFKLYDPARFITHDERPDIKAYILENKIKELYDFKNPKIYEFCIKFGLFDRAYELYEMMKNKKEELEKQLEEEENKKNLLLDLC